MCTKKTKVKKIRIEEKGKKAIFRNPSELDYFVTRVDGCLIKNGLRCDYLVSEANTYSALVELKGTDVKHACDQLFASVSYAEVEPLLAEFFGFLVVCRRYPRFDGFVTKAKQVASARYRAGFHVVSKNIEYDLREVVRVAGKI